MTDNPGEPDLPDEVVAAIRYEATMPDGTGTPTARPPVEVHQRLRQRGLQVTREQVQQVLDRSR